MDANPLRFSPDSSSPPRVSSAWSSVPPAASSSGGPRRRPPSSPSRESQSKTSYRLLLPLLNLPLYGQPRYSGEFSRIKPHLGPLAPIPCCGVVPLQQIGVIYWSSSILEKTCEPRSLVRSLTPIAGVGKIVKAVGVRVTRSARIAARPFSVTCHRLGLPESHSGRRRRSLPSG